VPLGQVSQEEEPFMLAKVPELQAWHAASPLLEDLPASHIWQSVGPVSSRIFFEKNPEGHREQFAEPVSLAKVPESQGVQAATAPPLNLPGSQSVHFTGPTDEEGSLTL